MVDSFRDAVSGAARQAYCNALVGIGVVQEPDPFPFPSIPQAAVYGWARDRYREFCNQEVTPPEQPPFSGGQCEFCYRVTAVLTVSNTGFPQLDGQSSQTLFLFGPIGPVTFEFIPESQPRAARLLWRGHGFCGPARSPEQVTIQGLPFSVPVPGLITIDSVTVQPEPPGPDTCGSPPPQFPEPRLPPPINLPDFTYNDNSGNVVNIPLTFNVGFAYFDNDLSLKIPIDVSVNDSFNVRGDFSPSFTVEFNVNTGGIEFRPPPVDPEQPLPDPRSPNRPDNFRTDDEPPPPPEEIPPEGEEPLPPVERERAIRGALVTVTSIQEPRNAGVLSQGENPDVWLPDLGLVSFLVRTGRNSTGWTEDLRIKNQRQLVTCPWPGGAIRVRGTPRQGVEWTITPVFGLVDQLNG